MRKQGKLSAFSMKKIVGLVFILTFSLSLSAQNKTTSLSTAHPAEYVNPFIGTGGHGHTYPGAQVPFGFMQLSPDTRLTGWDGCSAYHYSDTVIYGFSHTHLSGTGCSDYGDILIMPSSQSGSPAKYAFASAFSHLNETASPGYYSVLMKNGILAELSATARSGMHSYAFPYGAKARLLVDLKHRDEVKDSYIEIVSSTEIRGMRRSAAWATNQVIYFVMQFSKPIIATEVYVNDILQKGKTKFYQAKDLKMVFDFPINDKRSLVVKVGISGVDTTGARLNLENEMQGWNIDVVKANAKTLWNKELKKIEIESNDRAQMTIFYSALYHAMLSPNIFNDVDGRYMGRDHKIHKTDGWNYYTVFSLWDTFRALHPLLTMIDPKRTQDFVKTFIAQWEQGGLLPMWELSGNETDCMIGYHAVSVIFDAYIKGIRGFDLEKAFQAMKTSAMQTRLGIASMNEFGYVISDTEHESVSKTLEYAYDDWCIAQFAKILGKDADYQFFIKRAQGYKHVFDPQTGFMRPRFNGGWYSPFDPTEVNNHYTEANSWQYSFYAPQDISGLIQLHGGNANFEKKLDELFNTNIQMSGRNQADITGLIGQYAHGNEPSHHIAYLYNYIGKPEKTQQRIRQILREMYKNDPDGLSGNEDCGQMSAWYVMSALGLYAVCPGSDQLVIGSPLFKKATIHLENGKTFVVSAPNNSLVNTYIQSATLNGAETKKSYLTFNQMANGGELNLVMNDIPSGDFGKQSADCPSSIIADFLVVKAPVIHTVSRTFTDSLLVEINASSPTERYFYTINGKDADANSKQYTPPFYIHDKTTVKVMAIDTISYQTNTAVGTYIKVPKDITVKLTYPYNPQYTADGPQGIIDGIYGTTNWRLGGWQGYYITDFEAILDYSKVIDINEVGANFLQETRAWIVMPKEFEAFTSLDGVTFTSIGLVKQTAPVDNMETFTQPMVIKTKTKARFVKFVARNYGSLPAWHESAGEKAYVFVDEVWVK